MKISTFWLIILLILCETAEAKSLARVTNGVLDLRGLSLDEPIEASGNWDFYWNQLLSPDDLESKGQNKESMMVPGLWTQNGINHPAFGYATYKLKVLLDKPQRVAIYLPAAIWSSSQIFVDHEKIASFGTVGTDSKSAKGGTGSKIYEVVPQKSEFEVIIQVANFEIFLCGITAAPSFGTLDTITSMLHFQIAVEVFLIGCLFIMGIYHLCLYLLRREDPSTFWFGFFCLAIAVNLSYSIVGDFARLGFDARSRIYNISWIAGIPSFVWFSYFVFRGLGSRYVCWTTSLLALGSFILILATPSRVFVDFVNYFHIVTLLSLFYIMVLAVRGYKRSIEGSKIFLAGMFVMLIATTHDLLAARQIIKSPPVIGFGLLFFIFFQSFMIALRFSKAFRRIKISEKRIRSLSENLKQEHDKVVSLNSNLESLVDEKTRDIRTIMENIPLGIFMIKGDLGIHKDHSRSIEDIFSGQDIENSDATTLVFSDSTMTSDEKSKAISSIQVSLGETSFNFVANISNLPMEIRRVNNDGSEVVFDLTWNMITNAQDIVEKILVTMRDVTDIRTLQERTRHQQEELEFIGEIINIPDSRFLRFTQSCHDFLNENRKLIKSTSLKKGNHDLLKLLFINMHTIKGLARSLYFKKMTAVFHNIEQYYAILQNNDLAVWDFDKMRLDLEEAQQLVFLYERLARDKLGRNPEQARRIEFRIELIETLYRELDAATRGQSLPHEMGRAIDQVKIVLHQKLFKPANDVVEDIMASVPALAKDLQKEVPELILETQGICLGENAEDLFRKVFVHLIRNGLDHGIETPAERIQNGKRPKGTITIKMARHGQTMAMIYYDDGRGLNINRIRELGISKGLLPAEPAHDTHKIAELIFHSGMSTANRVNDISGRGVGMDAVRRFIQDFGGNIRVVLPNETIGPAGYCPFLLAIDLPFNLFEESSVTSTQNAA